MSNVSRVEWFQRDPGGSTTYIAPFKECEFCTRQAALACKDPVCRARGYGEPHREGCLATQSRVINDCTCVNAAR